MKLATEKPKLSAKQVEEMLLRAKIQPTAQRIAICRWILCDADHPTAEQVKAWADENFPKLSLATVYNTLRTLTDAGILREYRFPHSDKVIYDAKTENHFHFLDERTGQLFDVDPAHVRLETSLGQEFEVAQVDVVLRGTRRKRG